MRNLAPGFRRLPSRMRLKVRGPCDATSPTPCCGAQCCTYPRNKCAQGPALPSAACLSLVRLGCPKSNGTARAQLFPYCVLPAGKLLGWHTFTFTTTRAIPAHGVMLLKMSYSPQYADEL